MSKALLNPDIAKMIRDGVKHARNGTVELVDSIASVPVRTYTDPDRFELELDRVFRRLPLMLAPSCELPNPGDYKTMDVAGVPVLLIRGQDGAMRAFLNSCTHRGASVATTEHGNARRFTCQYHGWTFGQKGELIGVASPEDFGEIDKSCMGLKAMPTAERAGLIFVTLNPNSSLDVDDFLCGFDKLLDVFNLKDWHFLEHRQLSSPNWKITYDGTIDFYHLPVLHKNTLAVGGDYGNRALCYNWGPHQRVLNPDNRIKALADMPESEWTDMHVLSGNWSIFPNVTLASFNGGFADGRRAMMIIQILPGKTRGTAWTNQMYLMERPPENDDVAAQARAQFAFVSQVVDREDNVMGFAQQKAMDGGMTDNVLFGRNEGSGQTFHGWVEKVVAADDQQLNSMFRLSKRDADT